MAAKKRTKRPNGDGSIYQRASDGYWVGSMVLPDGKRKPIYGKSRDDVRDKLGDLQAKVRAGLPIKAGRESTLGTYMEQWLTVTLPQRVAAGDMAESTLVSYDYQARRHIIPVLGRKGLTKLSPADVRQWQTAKLAEPSGRKPAKGQPHKTISGTTVRYLHAILRACLADAMRDELVVRNVAELVVAPKKSTQEIVPLTEDEARALLSHALVHKWRVMWLVILALGLRRGEALAMRWSHLDLEAGTLRAGPVLQRVMSRTVDPELGRRVGRILVSAGKTQASQAVLPLPTIVIEALKIWKVEQKKARLAAPVWEDADLVMTTGLGTTIEPRNVNREWDKLCKAAEVRHCRVHDLRHTAGTFLFEEGIDVGVIQKVLRHSRKSTTADIYVHVREPLTRAAAGVMDTVLRRVM